jgi:hypothetical protein
MKKFLTLILLFAFAANNSLASPLIFKAKKEITSKGLVELATFDATRYKQIRIGIKIIGNSDQISTSISTSKAIAEIELNAAKRELKRKEELLEQGEISHMDYDLAKDRERIAQQKYDGAEENAYQSVSILGVEGSDEILIATLGERTSIRSLIIDSPPAKIRVKVSGKGMYSLYVWGQ